MKVYLLNYVEKNIKEIILITLIIFIGLIIGIIYINSLTDENISKVDSHVNSVVDYIKELNCEESKIDNTVILFSNLKRNILYIMLIGLFSLCIIGLPIMYLLIGFKSFSLGYTMSAILATLGTKSGIIFICSSMILHNIIYLIGIYLISISGIDLYKEIVVNKSEKIRLKIISHIIFIVISVLISVFAALVETFISNNLFIMLKDFI